MPQDAFTLNRICGELNDKFSGGTVNRIVQPDADTIVFTVFTGSRTEKLLISVRPDGARIGLTKSETAPESAPNFCMLLRKHLLSSVVKNISLVGFDRIVRLDFETRGELTDAKTVTLYAELMGRYSNAILTSDGKILGSNRGFSFDNGVRPLFVGRKYELPPNNDKLLPNDEKLIDFYDTTENIDATVLSNKVSGLATITAKAILSTFNGSGGREFFDHLNRFIYERQTHAYVLRENGQVKDYFVFDYDEEGEREYFYDLLSAEECYAEEKEVKKRTERLREKLLSTVRSAIKKEKKKLSGLNARLKDAESYEENRVKGELIVSNIYRIKRGDESVTCLNYYDGTEVTIPLDTTLTPSDNAQAYYKKYNKQKRTLSMIAPQIASAEKELFYYESVSEEISVAVDYSDLELIKEELISEGLIASESKKNKRANAEFGRTYSYSGYTVRIGRNNTENDRVTFTAKENDIWVHVKDYHSSHVIVESKKGVVDEKAIIFAAELCAYYSKARDGGKCEVVYTERRNVKKPPKSHPGFVTYTDFKSVTVEPKQHAEFAVKKQ